MHRASANIHYVQEMRSSSWWALLAQGKPWRSAIAGHEISASDEEQERQRLLLERFQEEVHFTHHTWCCADSDLTILANISLIASTGNAVTFLAVCKPSLIGVPCVMCSILDLISLALA